MKKEEKNNQVTEEKITAPMAEDFSAGKEEKEPQKEKAPKTASDLKEEFNSLIKGEYKEVYEEKIKENLSKRFKENEALKKELSDTKEILSALSVRYNLEPGDLEELKKAVIADDELFRHQAEKQGLDVKSYRHMKDLERENDGYKRQLQQYADDLQTANTMKQWYELSQTLASEYPDFDIAAEADNPQFVALVQKGVDLKTAYEIVHLGDIIARSKEEAAAKARKDATQEIMSRESRPEENGLSARSSAIIKTDVSKLSPKDRAELAKRAARGEKITF